MSAAVKVIFVGRCDIGKTTLIERILTNSFTESVRPTITNAIVTHEHRTHLGDPVTLELWDTAGQERFLALTETYFRSSQIALVCHDENATEIREWADRVRDKEAGCRIFTVLTKQDLYTDGQVSQALASAALIAKEYGGVALATSARTGAGVESLVEQVGEAAAAIARRVQEKAPIARKLEESEEAEDRECC